MSEWSAVRTGVPQGSILAWTAPLRNSISLSMIDLPTALLRCKAMLYTDDTTVSYSDSSVNNVQEVLTEDLGWLSSWISCNGLKLNLQKAHVVYVSVQKVLGGRS